MAEIKTLGRIFRPLKREKESGGLTPILTSYKKYMYMREIYT